MRNPSRRLRAKAKERASKEGEKEVISKRSSFTRRRKDQKDIGSSSGEELLIEKALVPAPLYQGDVVISSPKPLDLVPFLSCNICKGLLVSATTITNCLHSFCKSCLVKKMLNKERALYHCPTCGSSIGGFKGIREDCHLQQIVNKVVPNLENLEAERRKAFYEGSCKEEEGILENDEVVGQRGEDVNNNEEFIGGNDDSNLEEGTCENNNKLPEGYGVVAMEMDRFVGMEWKQEEDQGQGPGFGEGGAKEEKPILNDLEQEGSGGNDIGVEAVQAGNGRENLKGPREKHVAEAKKAVEALLSEFSLRILEEVFLEIKEVAKGARDVTLGEEGRKEASNRINYDLQEGQAMNNQAGEIPKEKGICMEDDRQKKFRTQKELAGLVDLEHLKTTLLSSKEDSCEVKLILKRERHGVHLKKRPFSCREDGFQVKFVSKKNMEEHVDQVHLKKRPFSCTYDGCQQKFGQKGNLAVHVDQVHLKKRPFSCNEDGCDKMFGRKYRLKDHMRSAHGAPKLVCKEVKCSASFVSSTLLYKHMMETH